VAGRADHAVHVARPADADEIGRLLDAFNREYDDPTPGPSKLAGRIVKLIEGGDTVVLLGGSGPDGVAVLRFRDSIWTEHLECYLAELYVTPDKRRQGLGRALMQAAFETATERGADYMDLNTSEADAAARALYESLGFSDREGKPDGPRNYYYERQL
jgi:ribosomal protein S18 acetylase RimI-like enzyme